MHPYKRTINRINDILHSDAFSFRYHSVLLTIYVHSSMTIKCSFENIGCHYKVFIGNIGYHYKVLIWKYRLSLIDIFTYCFSFSPYAGRIFLLIWLLCMHFWPESTPPFYQDQPSSKIVLTKTKCPSCTVNRSVIIECILLQIHWIQ